MLSLNLENIKISNPKEAIPFLALSPKHPSEVFQLSTPILVNCSSDQATFGVFVVFNKLSKVLIAFFIAFVSILAFAVDH